MNFDVAFSIANMSYANAYLLMKDAELLYANERYARAMFLCFIAEEELAKSVLSMAAAARIRIGEFDQVAEKEYNGRFSNHRLKSATIKVVIDHYFNHIPQTELLIQVKNARLHGEDRETVKQGSLYADFDTTSGEEGCRSPHLVCTLERADWVMKFYRALFEVANTNVKCALDQVKNSDIEVCRQHLHGLKGVF